MHHQQYLYLFQDRLRSRPSGSMKFHQKRFALAAMVTQLHNHLDIRILLGLSESPTGIAQTFLFMHGLNGNVLTLAEIMIECFLGKDNWRKILMIYILKVKNVHIFETIQKLSLPESIQVNSFFQISIFFN